MQPSVNCTYIDINTLFFDLVGVLLIQRKDYLSNELLDEIDNSIGQVENDKQFRSIIIEKFHLNDDGFQSIIQCIAEKYEAFFPLWKILPILKKHYKLGIINNGTYLTYPYFEKKYHISKQFDIFVSSGKEGVRKPNARIYLLACDKLGVKPEQCLFMDDTEENIIGAQNVGMHAIPWQNPESGYELFVKLLKNKSQAQHAAASDFAKA